MQCHFFIVMLSISIFISRIFHKVFRPDTPAYSLKYNKRIKIIKD